MRAHGWGGRSMHADIWAWTSCGTPEMARWCPNTRSAQKEKEMGFTKHPFHMAAFAREGGTARSPAHASRCSKTRS